MRATDQAQSTPTSADGHAQRVLVKLLVAVIATLALLVVWRPAVVGAQDAPPSVPQPPAEAKPAVPVPTVATARTHVVKAGETLWSLAARYYGDGHAWPQLAKINKIATDGHTPPLEVGMTLQVPVSKKVAGTKAAAVAAAPADSTVPKIALVKAGEGTLPTPSVEAKANAKAAAKAPAGSLAAQTAGKGNVSGQGTSRPAPKTPKDPAAPAASAAPAPAGAPAEPESLDLQRREQTLLGANGRVRIGLVSNEEQSAARKPNEVRTVFHRDIPDAAEAERRTKAVMRPNTPVPRQGELDAAPYLLGVAEHAQAGAITGRIGAPPSELDAYPDRALRSDEIALRATPKKSYRVGDMLQSYASMPSSVKGRLVAIPTGIVEVTAVRPNGEAVAVVREQSARIEQGQRLAAPAGAPAPRVIANQLPTPDVATTVLWLDPSQTIPTLQSYVLIGAGSGKGVKAGDEFALYHHPKGGAEAQTAVARVVRVGGDYATAVIVRQSGAEISTGMAARRIGKAP